MFPIRCFTCGKCIAHYEQKYFDQIKTVDKFIVLDSLGIKRICCRRMFLSYVDLTTQQLRISELAQKF